jgi:hypothetical protein
MRLTRFGGYIFPEYEAEDPLDTAPTERPFLELPDGAFDVVGTDRAPGWLRRIAKRFLVIADTPEALEDALDDLRSLNGSRAKLYAARSNGDQRWAWAACEGIRYTKGSKSATDQVVEALFALPYPGWNGNHHGPGWVLGQAGLEIGDGHVLGEYDVYPLVAGANVLSIVNGGKRRATAVRLTLTAAGGTITAVDVACGAAHWAMDRIPGFSLANGESLVVDAASQAVRKVGAEAFNYFDFGADHVGDAWLPLESGANAVSITLTGAGGTAAFTFWDSWE